MIRVLQLTSSYPRHPKDNSSIFLKHLFNNISEKDIEIHVLAPHDKQVQKLNSDKNVFLHWFKYFPTKHQRLAYGSGILPNLKNNHLLYLQVPFFLVSMFLYLFVLCIRIRPNVIHAHWIIPQGFIAVLTGKLLNIPVITTAHGGDAFSLKNKFLAFIKKFTIEHSSSWTSNTKATARAINLEAGTQKPYIIPMGIELNYFESGESSKVIGNEKRKIILFVGRLVEKKGVKYLIDAFSKLPDSIKSKSILWIIGDGSERRKLENQASTLKISNIRFWGEIQNNQLPDYYAAASVFVAPSITDKNGDTEGQGVILLEAMASKTPVITTNTGGIPEVIINNISGIVTKPKDANELADSIKYLLTNEKIATLMCHKAYQITKNKYCWHNISDQFISLYKS